MKLYYRISSVGVPVPDNVIVRVEGERMYLKQDPEKACTIEYGQFGKTTQHIAEKYGQDNYTFKAALEHKYFGLFGVGGYSFGVVTNNGFKFCSYDGEWYSSGIF